VIGRRVQQFADITRPGDYFGPARGYTGESEACFFLKPNARDEGLPPRTRSVQHICFPPHTYRECPDGSLEIRPSISNLCAGDVGGNTDDGWHGWLDEGHVWRQA
jgi:hypothetical protein